MAKPRGRGGRGAARGGGRGRGRGAAPAQRGGRRPTAVDSDDENVYDDVDTFNMRREKAIARDSDSEGASEDDVEGVMDVGGAGSSDESEESGGESDDSGQEDDGSEHIDQQWGKRRSAYYNTDYVDADLGHSTDDEEAAEEEEREARNLQHKQAARLSDADFGVPDDSLGEQLKKGKGKKAAAKGKRGAADDDAMEVDEGTAETVRRDISGLSKAEKLELIAKDAPELIELLAEFRDKIATVQEQLLPTLERARNGDLATSKGVSYLETKLQLMLSYLVNISFYLLLKADGRSVRDHPVIAQLVSLRAVMEKMRPLDQKLKYQVDKLIRGAAGGAEDPLRFKPNLAAMEGESDKGSDDGEGEESREEASEEADKYVPRKMLAVPYEDDSKAGKKRAKEDKARERALKSSVMRELRSEFSDRPEEIKDATGVAFEDDEDPAEAAHRQRYEEENFIRLDANKKRKGLSQRRMRNELDELTDFGGISALGRPERKEDPAEQLLKKRSAAEAFAAAENARRKGKGAVDGSAKKRKAMDDVDSADEAFYEEMKSKKARVREEREEAHRPAINDASEESVDGKRGISYQIQKNKGLTPRRKKEQRNPRVKHRAKYEKALIKRKSQVRQYSAPQGPYGGEATGIRAGIVKSVRIK